MPTWEEFLGRIIIFDGAMGTMLQAAGLDLGRCPELWNLERPEIIQDIHRAYVEAGAMVVETNSFGGNTIKLKEYGLADKTQMINRKAAELAKEAVGGKALVAGSVGPTGLLMEPYGTATFDDLYTAFFEQIRGLATGGADLICIETMSDLGEMRAALIAAKAACKLPVICTMTFEQGGSTIMGISPETAAYVLASLGADAIGANCSTGPEELLPVIKRMAQASSLPLIVQPNAGLPVMREGRVCYDQTPSSMAGFAPKFVEAGVQILGGCCGTTPEHIAAIARAASGLTPGIREIKAKTVLVGRRKPVIIDESPVPVVIGSRTGSPFRENLTAASTLEQVEAVVRDASLQVEAGAQIVDINVLFGGKEEPETMRQAVLQLQSTLDVPVAIDSANPEVVQAGLKTAKGKALLSAVTGEESNLSQLLPLAKKYGAAVLATAVDSGVRAQNAAADRTKIAEKIVQRAEELGINRSELIIDCLAGWFTRELPEKELTEVNAFLKGQLGVKTCLRLPFSLQSSLPKIDEEFLHGLRRQGVDMILKEF